MNKFWSLCTRWCIPCTAQPLWRWTGKKWSSLFLNPACLWTSATARDWDTKRRTSGAACWKVTHLLNLLLARNMCLLMTWTWVLCQDDVMLIRLKGLKESIKMSLTDSELLIEVMDEARRQVGVVYEQDSQWLASIPWLTWLTVLLKIKKQHLCNKKLFVTNCNKSDTSTADLWCSLINYRVDFCLKPWLGLALTFMQMHSSYKWFFI